MIIMNNFLLLLMVFNTIIHQIQLFYDNNLIFKTSHMYSYQINKQNQQSQNNYLIINLNIMEIVYYSIDSFYIFESYFNVVLQLIRLFLQIHYCLQNYNKYIQEIMHQAQLKVNYEHLSEEELTNSLQQDQITLEFIQKLLKDIYGLQPFEYNIFYKDLENDQIIAEQQDDFEVAKITMLEEGLKFYVNLVVDKKIQIKKPIQEQKKSEISPQFEQTQIYNAFQKPSQGQNPQTQVQPLIEIIQDHKTLQKKQQVKEQVSLLQDDNMKKIEKQKKQQQKMMKKEKEQQAKKLKAIQKKKQQEIQAQQKRQMHELKKKEKQQQAKKKALMKQQQKLQKQKNQNLKKHDRENVIQVEPLSHKIKQEIIPQKKNQETLNKEQIKALVRSQVYALLPFIKEQIQKKSEKSKTILSQQCSKCQNELNIPYYYNAISHEYLCSVCESQDTQNTPLVKIRSNQHQMCWTSLLQIPKEQIKLSLENQPIKCLGEIKAALIKRVQTSIQYQVKKIKEKQQEQKKIAKQEKLKQQQAKNKQKQKKQQKVIKKQQQQQQPQWNEIILVDNQAEKNL